jgi:hypothetical protein
MLKSCVMIFWRMWVMQMQKQFHWWIQLKSDVLSLHIPWTAQTIKVDAAFIYGFEKLLDFEYSRGKHSNDRFSAAAIR